MSNAKDIKIKQLEEQNRELHRICQRQRDSLAAQQEAIVQLNISLDSTLACLAEKYGELKSQEVHSLVRVLSIPAEAYPGVLDRLNVSAAMVDGCYVITVAPKPQDGEAQQEPAPEVGIVDDGTLHRDEYGCC